MTETQGLVIVNTGNGKGKTTAALGMGMRAWGQGLRVLVVQFIKGSWKYGELKAIEKLAFFLKPDEEKLLRKIRHFTSAKFYPELNLYNHFWETYNMAPSIFTNEASTIFKDYFNAYRTLKDNFIAGKDLDIISILEKNSIDKQIEPIFKSAEAKIAMNELFFDGGHRY